MCFECEPAGGAGEGSLQGFLAANPDFLEQAGELEGGLEGANQVREPEA